MLKADATKELEAPRCYVPIWVPVESPLEKIQRAKEDLAASSMESNDTKSPKSQRERKKSKSKSGEEKSADEGEKVEKTEGLALAKVNSAGDSESPLKKSPVKSSKSPKKSVGEEEPNAVQN